MALLGTAALVVVVAVVALDVERGPGDVTARQPERIRLTSLIQTERQRVERLREIASDLRRRLAEPVSRSAGGSGGQILDPELEARLEAIREAAGLVAVSGPGVVVELDDAREALAELDRGSGANLNDYVIHSQDVQAVANGLWAAGAEAVAVNGERLIPTSALLCVGNTLLVNGTVHSPPYRFDAVGDADEMLEALESDPLVEQFVARAERFGLGFEAVEAPALEVPEYRGSTSLTHAQLRRSGD